MALLAVMLTAMRAWAVATTQFPIYDGDEGTESAPYQIKTIDDLNKLAADVNSGTTYSGKYFKLMNDLTFTYSTAWDDAESTESNFTPIGKGVYFQGHFDGNGKTISGLRIYGSNTTETGWGLFGRTLSAEVKNITLADARITGCAYTGGIVGSNQGIVSNCHVEANVTIVANSSNSGYGGIAGQNYNAGTVSHCTSAVKITLASGMNPTGIGGIVGRNESTGPYATLTDNLAIGAVIPAAKYNMHAAIATDVCTSSSAHYHYERNYYRDCTVAGTANATDVGIASYYNSSRISVRDVNTDDDPNGAVLAYTLTLAQDNIISDEALLALAGSIAADNSAVAYGGTVYIGSGSTVTLNIQETLPYTYCVTDDTTNERIWLADGQFTMPANDVTVTLTADMSWDELKSAVAAGGMVTLTGNVKRNADEAIEIDKDVTLDLKGYTVYGYAPGSSEHYRCNLFDVLSGGRLTVTDSGTGGRITNVGHYAISIKGESAESYGSLTLSAGTISNALTAVEIYRYGKFTMTGGNITANEYGVYVNTVNATATFTVSGNVNITGNTSKDIYYDNLNSKPIYIGGTLASTARIGINIENGFVSNFTSFGYVWPLTSGLPGRGTKQNFVLNGDQGLALVIPASGELAVAADTWRYDMSMGDNADNSADIANHQGETVNATLSGRTLYKDGDWNTLCLPFDVTVGEGSPLAGGTAMTLNTETSNLSGEGLLTVNFDNATSIPAGTPFIIKWDGDGTSNIENPVFEDVTVSDATNDATIPGVLTFTGTYAPEVIPEGGDNTKLYLGSGNKLYYPNAAMTIGTHRAYFQLAEGITAGEPVSGSNAKQIRASNLNFGDDEATGIVSIDNGQWIVDNEADAWYTLDGRKLVGKPTQRGIYIINGKKTIIK